MTARNVRNNNPGNVEADELDWMGLADPPTDGPYLVFTDPKYGFRCAARCLLTDYGRGETTVTALITSWAPPSANDTAAYVIDVAEKMGTSADATLSLPAELRPLLKAIALHEGGCPWADSVIEAGIELERSG